MKSRLYKIIKSLNLNGRDWAAMLLALLLAFSTWLIHKLSLQYTEYVSVQIAVKSNIHAHSDISENKAEVMAKCRTSGYNVLRSKLRSGETVQVEIDQAHMKQYYDDRYYITSDKLHEYADAIFGSNVDVELFVTDTLIFRFLKEDFKRVPIKPQSYFTFREQYVQREELQIEPDSVTIYGEPQRLQLIDYVPTEVIREYDIASNLNGMIGLTGFSGVRMSDDEVHYSMNVSRYVEMTVEAPVKVRNLPPGKNLLVYPSTVNVTLMCEFPVRADIHKKMTYYVDYRKYETSLSGKCVVEVSNQPLDVIGYKVNPFAVNCVEEILK